MPRAEGYFGSKLLGSLIVFLILSAGYLYAFPQPNVFYAGVVLLHAVAGVVATILLLAFFYRLLRNSSFAARLGWLLLLGGGVLGCILIYSGTPRVEWNWLYFHMILSLAGAGILFADGAGKRGWLGSSAGATLIRTAVCLGVLAGLGTGAWYLRNSRWQNRGRIENPTMPPATMNGEGDGPDGPFFPSSAQVYGGQKIPSKYFMESDSCKRCHEDVYNQWFSSAHHFSSFNNQWYRKSVEYMQDTVGTRPSKWCGGCHDPAVLYSGLMDTPIKQIVHRPEAQAGLGCMMCHSIADVKSTMGQGDFYLEYPKLHELAATKNPVARALHDFLVKLIIVIVPLAAIYFREAPEVVYPAVTSDGTGGKARVLGWPPNAVFALMCGAAVLCCIPMAMPQGHLVAFCSDLCIARSVGALMLSVLLGTAFLSRQIWCAISDRIGGLSTVLIGSAWQAASMTAFLFTQNEVGLFTIAAAFGLGFSGIIPAYVLALRELFPASEASWRIPTLLLFSGLGMASGGWLAGLLYDHFGYYAPAFAAGIGANLLNLMVVAVLVGRQRYRAAFA